VRQLPLNRKAVKGLYNTWGKLTSSDSNIPPPSAVIELHDEARRGELTWLPFARSETA